MRESFFRFLAIFLMTFAVLNLFSAPRESDRKVSDLEISTKKKWTVGQLLNFKVQNNLPESFVVADENLIFEKWRNGRWESLPAVGNFSVAIAAGESRDFSFAAENNSLFSASGKMRATLRIPDSARSFSAEFEISEPGIFRTIFREVFFKPIFNLLIFLIKVLPGHKLGAAILILTIFLKILLLRQNRRALENQKKMSGLQADLQKLQKRYANDSQKLSRETLALWRKHKVNPFATFLPIFFQFPILIALYFAVRDGLSPHNSVFLYSPLQNFDLNLVAPNFLGMNLNADGVWILAIAVAALQFFSAKLSTAQNSTKTKKSKSKKNKNSPENLAGLQKTMLFVLPAVIGFFTWKMPAAVGFYWGVSTVFQIGQQLFLNRKTAPSKIPKKRKKYPRKKFIEKLKSAD